MIPLLPNFSSGVTAIGPVWVHVHFGEESLILQHPQLTLPCSGAQYIPATLLWDTAAPARAATPPHTTTTAKVHQYAAAFAFLSFLLGQRTCKYFSYLQIMCLILFFSPSPQAFSLSLQMTHHQHYITASGETFQDTLSHRMGDNYSSGEMGFV